MHYFTRDFLALAADHVRNEGVYHIAKKKIPSKDGPVQVKRPLKGLALMPVPSTYKSTSHNLIGATA